MTNFIIAEIVANLGKYKSLLEFKMFLLKTKTVPAEGGTVGLYQERHSTNQ